MYSAFGVDHGEIEKGFNPLGALRGLRGGGTLGGLSQRGGMTGSQTRTLNRIGRSQTKMMNQGPSRYQRTQLKRAETSQKINPMLNQHLGAGRPLSSTGGRFQPNDVGIRSRTR